MLNNTQENRREAADLGEQDGAEQKAIGMSVVPMNFDVDSYQFDDLDLKVAVEKLPERDRNILILRLMGHTQYDMANITGDVTRSMISKRLRIILNNLARHL